jgi:predicted membrane protein (TIGR00267 family)
MTSDNTETEDHHGIVERLMEELVLTGRYSLARRHVAEEVFDSVLPILGVILAGYISAHMQELFVVFEATLLAAVGTSIAHFVSGFGGTYLAEEAEGRHLIEELKKSQGSRLSPAVIVSIERETTMLLSFIRGSVPAVSVLVIASPMVLAVFGWIDYLGSFLVSIGVGLGLLFLLGIFLGRISKTSIWIGAGKTLLAGLLTLALLFIVSMLTGA